MDSENYGFLLIFATNIKKGLTSVVQAERPLIKLCCIFLDWYIYPVRFQVGGWRMVQTR